MPSSYIWPAWNCTTTTATTGSTAAMWGAWTYTVVSATAAAATDCIWAGWTADTGTGSTTATVDLGVVWAGWHDYLIRTVAQLPNNYVRREVAPVLMTDPAEAERQRLAFEERAARRELAEAVADELLNKHLTRWQRRCRRTRGYFNVRSSGGRRFRVHTDRGFSGNVEELVKGKAVARYCAHPSAALPHSDHYLAQKLALELDEGVFLRVANRTALRPEPPARVLREAFGTPVRERVA